KNKNAKRMRGRSWPLYDDWVLIFGKDRTTGEFAQGLEEMIDDNSVVRDVPKDANVEAQPTEGMDNVSYSQSVTQGREEVNVTHIHVIQKKKSYHSKRFNGYKSFPNM
ncbi:unnamed protein product, partial [Ilex paraguariensis]